MDKIPRILIEASNATPSINIDVYDMYIATAQAVAMTAITITGSSKNGQKLWLSWTDNATARALTP